MIDIDAIIESLESAVGRLVKAMKDNKPDAPVIKNVIDIPKQPDQKAPVVNITTAEQKAPVVNIKQPDIKIDIPEIKIPSSEINLLGANGWDFEFEYDKFDRIVKAKARKID